METKIVKITEAENLQVKQGNNKSMIENFKVLIFQKIRTSHEFVKRIILEGFFKLFTISQIDSPDLIW